MSKKWLIPLFAGSVLGVVLLLVLILLLTRSPSYERFKPHVDEYLAVAKEETEGGAYVNGKMVVIGVVSREVDAEIFDFIPKEMRAANPEEAGTVVLLKWSNHIAGLYLGKEGARGAALVPTCEVTIIDRSIPAIVGRKGFRGGAPAMETRGWDESGSRPTKEIVDYLVSLPRESESAERAPEGWTVLFRSDNPAVWNTDSRGAQFAMPCRRAHKDVRFLRIKRMDTGEALIAPITRSQLVREDRPDLALMTWWNGTAAVEWGGRHLGLCQLEPLLRADPGKINVSNHVGITGSGFGHKVGVDDRQYCCWQGAEIPNTTFEIAVRVGPLPAEETKDLVRLPDKATPPEIKPPEIKPKEPPRSPAGTKVPEAIGQPPPPTGVPGKTMVDLIPLIDPGVDTVHGRWLVADGVLHCNDMHGVPRLQIPYQPPEEYDFLVVFSQPRLRNGISMIMPNPRGGSFFLGAGFWGGTGFNLLGDKRLPVQIAPNQSYTAMVQVRRDGVKAFLDGKLLAEHKTDFRDLKVDGYREIPDPTRLAVACDDPTVFHYVRLVEITGKGKKMR